MNEQRERFINALTQAIRNAAWEGNVVRMPTEAARIIVGMLKGQGWISVKDRLPEEKINPLTQDFQKVICYCDFGGEPKRTDIRTYGFGTRAWESQPHFWDGQCIMDGVITHWMSMPEPPKEAEND